MLRHGQDAHPTHFTAKMAVLRRIFEGGPSPDLTRVSEHRKMGLPSPPALALSPGRAI